MHFLTVKFQNFSIGTKNFEIIDFNKLNINFSSRVHQRTSQSASQKTGEIQNFSSSSKRKQLEPLFDFANATKY